MWSSPIIRLLLNTIDAISDGYYEGLIIDPGHTRIKFFDKIMIILTWITAIVIVVPTVIHYLSLDNVNNSDVSIVLLTIFFPYFANINISILLYINTIVLFIYNKNRQNIIRRINEKNGTW